MPSSAKKRTTRDPAGRPGFVGLPMLGALLRLARQEVVNHIERQLANAGMGDVSPSQWAVTQQLGGSPEGLRLTELAAYAGLTKPSMSALVDGLEASGYVERVAHPTDKRAQLVRFTERGWELGAVSLRAMRAVEKSWASRIGADDLETLRCVLRRVVESRPPLPDEPIAKDSSASSDQRTRLAGQRGRASAHARLRGHR